MTKKEIANIRTSKGSLIVTHTGKPHRMTRWLWQQHGDNIRWSIVSFLDGYYQAGASRDGEMPVEDFEKNLYTLTRLSPKFFKVEAIPADCGIPNPLL